MTVPAFPQFSSRGFPFRRCVRRSSTRLPDSSPCWGRCAPTSTPSCHGRRFQVLQRLPFRCSVQRVVGIVGGRWTAGTGTPPGVKDALPLSLALRPCPSCPSACCSPAEGAQYLPRCSLRGAAVTQPFPRRSRPRHGDVRAMCREQVGRPASPPRSGCATVEVDFLQAVVTGSDRPSLGPKAQRSFTSVSLPAADGTRWRHLALRYFEVEVVST
jgi:hypothetical protein